MRLEVVPRAVKSGKSTMNYVTWCKIVHSSPLLTSPLPEYSPLLYLLLEIKSHQLQLGTQREQDKLRAHAAR